MLSAAPEPNTLFQYTAVCDRLSFYRSNFYSPLFPSQKMLLFLHSCSIFAYLCSSIFLRQAMIDEFDLDQDGEINEQEFFAIMTDDP